MTTGATAVPIPQKAQAAFQQFFTSCWNMANTNWNIRESLRQKDLVYMREQDYTPEQWRAKYANMGGDPNKFQNITVPLVLPQVEAAVTYMEGVFLTGNPIFGVTSPPEFADAALQMDAINEENEIRGSWRAELSRFFRDGLKYNISFLEAAWEDRVVARLETDTAYSVQQGKPKEVIWSGNVLRRWDPYNTFFDTRVAPRDLAEQGEFIGRTQLMSRIALKDYINRLPDKLVSNIQAAFESGVGGANTSYDKYYVPFVNPFALLAVTDPRASTDWMAWAGLANSDPSKIQYQNMYQLNTIYARILPSDFGLRVPAPNTPQIWKLVFVNGQVLIYAERQTNAHNLLPVIAAQPLDDGLDFQTKSFADNIQPFQAVGTALMNSMIASRRRAISDRVLYDPSRIDAREINNPSPTAKIPIRAAAYGKPLGEAVYPFPFRDDQAGTAMQELQQMTMFANMVSGQNQASQGQFVKGNKTLHEYADVMQNANARNQSIAIGLEANTFTKIKEILKLNILQYQGSDSIYSASNNKEVEIDPVALRKATMSFKISDGLLPSDKIINTDTFGTFMQYAAANPAIQQEYNLGDMVSYLMKMQGADLKPFQKQPAQMEYEQAVQQWQQTMMMYAQQKMQPPNIPQPKPSDYGYDPNNRGGQPATTNQQSIMQQVAGVMSMANANPSSPVAAQVTKNGNAPIPATSASAGAA